MRIHVNRFVSDGDTTISQIYVNGKFQCFGLEDEYRAYKEIGETRISAGHYEVGLRNEGGFHNRYGKRFGHLHQGMLEIKNVPDFKWVLIHCGNTDDDTSGCLLVGEGAVVGEDMMITSSMVAYKKLYAKVIDAAKVGELSIEFVDTDR